MRQYDEKFTVCHYIERQGDIAHKSMIAERQWRTPTNPSEDRWVESITERQWRAPIKAAVHECPFYKLWQFDTIPLDFPLIELIAFISSPEYCDGLLL